MPRKKLGPITSYVNDFNGFYSQKGTIWAGSVSKDQGIDSKDAFVFILERK